MFSIQISVVGVYSSLFWGFIVFHTGFVGVYFPGDSCALRTLVFVVLQRDLK